MKLTPLILPEDPAIDYERITEEFHTEDERGPRNELLEDYTFKGDVSLIEPYIREGMEPVRFWVRDLEIKEAMHIKGIAQTKSFFDACYECFKLGVQSVTNLPLEKGEGSILPEWKPREISKRMGTSKIQTRMLSDKEINEHFTIGQVEGIGALIYSRSFR